MRSANISPSARCAHSARVSHRTRAELSLREATALATRASYLPVYLPSRVAPKVKIPPDIAMAEARSLLALLRTGETVDGLRKLIGNSPERRKVLFAFDLLAQQIPKHPEKMRTVKLRMHSNGSAAGPALRAEIIRLLNLNLSQRKVCARLKIARSVVEQVARETGAVFRKRGRGRRFTSQVLGQIRQAVRNGERAVDICNQFHVCRERVQKFRREFGDFEDRRCQRGYDVRAVKRALVAGKPLSEIEQTFGIAHAVLWKLRRQCGDWEDRRSRNRRIFSDAEKAEIIADIRAGMSQRAIGKMFHTHLSQVRRIEAEAGLSRKYRRLTADEIAKINGGFRAGMRNGEIAKSVGCSHAAIWLRRKAFLKADL
jgi:hypothetical protein